MYLLRCMCNCSYLTVQYYLLECLNVNTFNVFSEISNVGDFYLCHLTISSKDVCKPYYFWNILL